MNKVVKILVYPKPDNEDINIIGILDTPRSRFHETIESSKDELRIVYSESGIVNLDLDIVAAKRFRELLDKAITTIERK